MSRTTCVPNVQRPSGHRAQYPALEKTNVLRVRPLAARARLKSSSCGVALWPALETSSLAQPATRQRATAGDVASNRRLSASSRVIRPPSSLVLESPLPIERLPYEESVPPGRAAPRDRCGHEPDLQGDSATPHL